MIFFLKGISKTEKRWEDPEGKARELGRRPSSSTAGITEGESKPPLSPRNGRRAVKTSHSCNFKMFSTTLKKESKTGKINIFS